MTAWSNDLAALLDWEAAFCLYTSANGLCALPLHVVMYNKGSGRFMRMGLVPMGLELLD